MEKSRNYVVFGVLALVVSLVAVSLAYAGFTQNLNINGTASINSVNWNVHFENVVVGTPTGGATWGTQPAVVGSTTIGDYTVNFTTPGSAASFEFDVVDSGSFDARMTGLTKGSITCTSTDTNWNGSSCASKLSYVLEEKTGANTYGSAITAADNSKLDANGGKRTYRLTLSYNETDNSSDLPTAAVTISGLSVVFTYTQDGNAQVTP